MALHTYTTTLIYVLCSGALLCVCADDEGRPVIRTEYGPVVGQRTTYNNTNLDVFYGIPYAKPPLGDLRFLKPQPPTPWEDALDATRKPTACRQIELVFSKNATFSYANASEDCLYINVIRPTCSNSTACEKPLPVMVYVHGGAFQWGDSSLVFFDGRNFVAATGIILVSFNYRVGVFGFLSTETKELPGNMGLWDQNMALKWVKNNIASFGGNSEEITLCGQSAGGMSVGVHALSPHSKGLFKRIIMQSGTPLSSIMSQSYRGVSRLLTLAGLLDCYDRHRNWMEQLQDMLDCLRTKDAGDIIATVRRQKYTQQIFVPVVGDDFVPEEPRHMNPLVVNSAQVFAGTTLNEGTLLVENLRYISPGLFEALMGDYRMGITLATSVLGGLTLSESKRIVHSYYGGYDVQHNNQKVIELLAEMVGDAVFHCPAHFYLSAASQKGVKSYRYIFAHRPSYSVWPGWMGATHTDDIPFTLGSLPHIKEQFMNLSSRETSLARLLGMNDFTYTPSEEQFLHEDLMIWKSFVVSGTPTIPSSDDAWPEYTGSTPNLVYLRPQNYTKGPAPKHHRCMIWKKYLTRDNVHSEVSTPKLGKVKPSKSPKQKTKRVNAIDDNIASKAEIVLPSTIVFLSISVSSIVLRSFAA
ncbi:acetylcholinesterase-like [Ornithodoros turicata]|uniref:acetylcholinesterase-like n=1 Tax=Ornithodoros turicata TaxID=34597 RepID=UPI0031389CC2